MTAIKERGETAFEVAGEGCFLRFTNRDLKEIQAKYGKTFLNTLTDELLNNVMDIDFLCDCYFAGTKGPDGNRYYATDKGTLDEEKMDDLQVALHAETLLDSLYMSIHGKKFKEFMEQAAEAFKELEGRDTPPPVSTLNSTSSILSGDSPSGQASE